MSKVAFKIFVALAAIPTIYFMLPGIYRVAINTSLGIYITTLVLIGGIA